MKPGDNYSARPRLVTVDGFDGLFVPDAYANGSGRVVSGVAVHFSFPRQGGGPARKDAAPFCTFAHGGSPSQCEVQRAADTLKGFAEMVLAHGLYRRHVRGLHMEGWRGLHVLWDGKFAVEVLGPGLTERWQAFTPTAAVYHHVAAEWWRAHNIVRVPVEP
jgi:hypothetical protein